jgi:hypothetical protein
MKRRRAESAIALSALSVVVNHTSRAAQDLLIDNEDAKYLPRDYTRQDVARTRDLLVSVFTDNIQLLSVFMSEIISHDIIVQRGAQAVRLRSLSFNTLTCDCRLWAPRAYIDDIDMFIAKFNSTHDCLIHVIFSTIM